MLLPTAEGEGRRVVLLGGEAGSGKSRLVREFAAEAARSGALVLHGACDAVVHAPYGPFSQALERLTAVLDEHELRTALGACGGELIRLLPNLGEQLAGLSPPVRADPDTERARLHAAVTELLERVGQRRPVVLVIEDGHWADAPTLLLLRHLAQTAWAGRVLLFATFRDTEDEVPQALAQTLADLRRSDDVVRMRLERLSDLEVSEFVRRVTEGRASTDLPEIARAISNLTGGNAFLVCELWRALVETDVIADGEGELRLAGSLLAQLETPDSVREVVSARLARLAPATTELLELAAMAGAEFELAIVGRARAWKNASWSQPSMRRHAAASSWSCPTASSRIGSVTSSCAAPSTTACQACAGPSCTCASARRSRRRRGARRECWPTSRTTSPRPPRSRDPSGRSASTCSLRGPPPMRSRSTRRRSCS